MAVQVEKLFKEWRDDPEYLKAYEALEPEFQILREMLKARKRAGLTQAQVARRMKTTQSAVARVESGRMPSIATLKKYAKATASKLIILLQPDTDRRAPVAMSPSSRHQAAAKGAQHRSG